MSSYSSIFSLFFFFFLLGLISSVVSSSMAPAPAPADPSMSPPVRFHRPDPLRGFKYYNGGFDLRDPHYWAAAAFTGVHGYAVAGVWLVFGLGFGIYLILHNLSHRASPITENSSSASCYLLVMLLLVLFTLLAIIATGIVLAANQQCLYKTKGLKETALEAGSDARKEIHKVNKVMKEIGALLCPYDPSTCFLLNATTHRLGRESRIIYNFIQKDGHSIDRAIWISYLANLVVVTVNLVLSVSALVLVLLHWQPGFVTVLFLCWILTMACWVLTGFDFFIHTFAEDTCAALEDFEVNPQKSSLSSLIPCSDSVESQGIMVEIGRTIHNFITELNTNIMRIQKEMGLDEENENLLVGTRAKEICDPFSGAPTFSFVPGKCPKDAIPIGHLPDILSRFTCYKAESSKCNGRFIPETTYAMAYAYSRSIEGIVDIFPSLEGLLHCSFVKSRFSQILSLQCRPFKVSTTSLWASMLSLSIVMVGLISVWVVKAFQFRGR